MLLSELNYEAFMRGDLCWVDDCCDGFNVGVGISVSGRSSNGVATWGYGIFFNRASHFCRQSRAICYFAVLVFAVALTAAWDGFLLMLGRKRHPSRPARR
jgi:hypothetical protein